MRLGLRVWSLPSTGCNFTALAVETGGAALAASRDLAPRDIAVYVGIPFCPTRCAYCSFVSQSVEKSFSLVDPYVDALVADIQNL